MPLQKLQFRPGTNRESTTLANEGGWFESDKVRFRSGSAEKIGGWIQDTGTAASNAVILPPPTGSFWGICRSLGNWVTQSFYNLVGLGTTYKFYIQNGVNGTFHDVTPIRSTTAAGDVTFAATNTSKILIVTDALHGAQAGDFVTYSGAVSLGGVITAAVLNKEYQVTAVTSNDVYTITASVAANASDTGNGGAATVGRYQITAGADGATVGVGWGAGGWSGVNPPSPVATTVGVGGINSLAVIIPVVSNAGFSATGRLLIESEIITYTGLGVNTFTGCARGQLGTAAASHAASVVVQDDSTYLGWGQAAPAGLGFGIQARLWSQANYGQDLIFNPRGGPLYYWAVNANPEIFDRATQITATDAPTICNFVMVSDASRFVLAFGVNDYGSTTQNALLVRWSNQEDYTDWTPAVTNQAGSYQLSRGSGIVTALQTRQEILVWTDASLYSMQYLGPPYVWGFQILADNISIAGQNTAVTVNNITYWMGVDKFYMYSGRVETLPCTLRSYVYNDINLAQAPQFFGGTNEGFNEVWWFYCSISGSNGTGTVDNPNTSIDRYVIYNHLERVWYYGTMSRSAWLDSPLRAEPIATTLNAQLIYHETGVDDGTTNPPSPITAYVQSSDFDIGDGHNFGFVWRIIPDVTFDGSTSTAPTLDFTVRPRQFPGSNYGVSDNPAVSSTQSYANQRTYNVQQFTEQVYVRVRGRQMAFRVGSDQLGTAWQLGVPRMDVRPDGRK